MYGFTKPKLKQCLEHRRHNFTQDMKTVFQLKLDCISGEVDKALL